MAAVPPSEGAMSRGAGADGADPLGGLAPIIAKLQPIVSQRLIEQGATCMQSTAWYRKTRPTFSDALAWVRRHIWDHSHFSMSQQETDMIEIPRTLFERFIHTVCYAA